MSFRRSLGFKFLIGFTLMVFPLLFFLFYNNIYAMNVVRNQVATTNMTLLAPYVQQIDSSLKETSQYLYYKADSDFELNTLNYYPYGSTDYVLTRLAIVNKFNTDMNLNNNLDALFVYEVKDHDLSLVTADQHYQKQAMIESKIQGLIQDYEQLNWRDWKIVQVEANFFWPGWSE